MRLLRRFFLLSVFFIALQTKAAERLELTKDWKFRKVGEKNWFPAIVPGTIHTDLLYNQLIPDPFFGDNEKLVQWVDTCSWEYACTFNCPPSLLSHQEIELTFEGLDTYADVFLNDSLVLQADNMFRSWRISCKALLKAGENNVRIRFYPTQVIGKKIASGLPYTLPGDEKVFTRKAAYQYGWDWGPRFVSCGIWKPVQLFAWDNFCLRDIHINQKQLNDTFALLGIRLNVQSNITGPFYLKLKNKNTKQDVYNNNVIHTGINSIEFNYKIYKPNRWWCNGYGEPYLYHFTVIASDAQTGSKDSIQADIGLRTIELLQQRDSSGKTFSFLLNNVQVFMKGANYIPMDNFTPRVSHEAVDHLLEDAVKSNFNMLRVWGGGIYESDYFYNQCDSLGILIWQDFMFACAMYPSDSAFLDNVGQEVRENVSRLRNHPCIALWCGNNEISEGWYNWEWQKQYAYTKKDSTKIWTDYLHLFHEIIPNELGKLDPGRPYIESSPAIGWGHKESLQEGDSHYWGVWWGMEPMDIYKTKVGRFMSEYGFQSLPAPSTLRTFLKSSDQNLESHALKNHQKHPTGFETISTYMKSDFPQPSGFNQYTYYSQVQQADGVRTAIEAHRRAKPYCMGTLYWQFNDCWPAVSWSSRDYFGKWKALQYNVKEAYGKILLSTVIEGPDLNVYLVSDSLQNFDGDYEVKLMDFDGRIKWREKGVFKSPANSSVVIFSVDTSEILATIDPGSVVFVTSISQAGMEFKENLFYFRKIVDLRLGPPDAKIEFDKSNSLLRVSAKHLVKNLWIELDGDDQLENNYFDVLPGKEYSIRISSLPGSQQAGSIIYQTLNHVK